MPHQTPSAEPITPPEQLRAELGESTETQKRLPDRAGKAQGRALPFPGRGSQLHDLSGGERGQAICQQLNAH